MNPGYKSEQCTNANNERANCNYVLKSFKLGKLLVVKVSPRHTFKTDYHHGEEGDIDSYECNDKSYFTKSLVVHLSGHFWKQVKYTSEHSKRTRNCHHIVKVSNNKMRIMYIKINSCHRIRYTRQSTYQE